MSGHADEESPSWLAVVRANDRYHWIALVSACILGLVLATIHWVGLVLGGAFVGVLATTLKRALLSGAGFGILVVVVWAGLLRFVGSFGDVTAMNEIALLPVGIALGLALLGSTLRGALA
ncbi:hypothetical protein SAMN05216226_10326 [Halovenus aranensis]|jgi:hypothetical protein|uniref:Uncharacterized protein n=1 Tax=Halovenus aranensis TaxID=890420 RepID=A0A1G8TEJ3_9EURY|nr:hypothetical protein [Halovenus aranensis]SDJ39986.1 hypothetical protein SAMN05216226_10326 [Halovenus aranensis]